MTSMIGRRAFVAGSLAFLAPLAARALQAGKAYRIGVLGIGEPQLLRQTLREAGYVEGENLTIEWRSPEGKPERFGDLAAELVRLKVDVLVASNPLATIAAKKATASIPIVMLHTPDPAQLGLVTSLGRPGANITGTTTLSADLSVKQLELLKRAIPQATRVAVLWNPVNPWHPLALKAAENAARPLVAELQSVEARTPEELEAAFAAIVIESGADPVQLGLVASLAQPGGNVTGVTSLSSELIAKRLQLLRELLPKSLGSPCSQTRHRTLGCRCGTQKPAP